MRSKKKTVKGMTLIEVIIAILVLGIMGSMMAVIGSNTSKMMIATNHLNNKTEVEAPVAISRDKGEALKPRLDPAGNNVAVPSASNPGQITVSSSKFATYSYDVEKYSTAAVGAEQGDQARSDGMTGDLVFYIIK